MLGGYAPVARAGEGEVDLGWPLRQRKDHNTSTPPAPGKGSRQKMAGALPPGGGREEISTSPGASPAREAMAFPRRRMRRRGKGWRKAGG